MSDIRVRAARTGKLLGSRQISKRLISTINTLNCLNRFRHVFGTTAVSDRYYVMRIVVGEVHGNVEVS